jgi:periplasmic protein TonB
VDYAEAQRNPGKPVGLIVVIVLHVLMGWILISGLGKRMVEVALKPVETKLIEEIKPPPPPPPENLPPPPKNLPPPPSYVPPPEVNVNPPPVQAPTITTTTVAPPPQPPVSIAPAPTPPAPPAPPRVAARPAIANASSCAPTRDDYPPAAIRAEATGITKVRFNIDETGKLVKIDLVRSAGSSREHRALDKVAIEKLSECSFKPGLDENGRPTGGTFEVEYVWKLD